MGNIYKNNIRSKNFKIILSIIIIAIICIIAIFQLLHNSDPKKEDKVRYTEKKINDKIKQIDEERTAYLGEVFENVNLNVVMIYLEKLPKKFWKKIHSLKDILEQEIPLED